MVKTSYCLQIPVFGNLIISLWPLWEIWEGIKYSLKCVCTLRKKLQCCKLLILSKCHQMTRHNFIWWHFMQRHKKKYFLEEKTPKLWDLRWRLKFTSRSFVQVHDSYEHDSHFEIRGDTQAWTGMRAEWKRLKQWVLQLLISYNTRFSLLFWE